MKNSRLDQGRHPQFYRWRKEYSFFVVSFRCNIVLVIRAWRMDSMNVNMMLERRVDQLITKLNTVLTDLTINSGKVR